MISIVSQILCEIKIWFLIFEWILRFWLILIRIIFGLNSACTIRSVWRQCLTHWDINQVLRSSSPYHRIISLNVDQVILIRKVCLWSSAEYSIWW
jgi:hypothetical protein